MTDLVQGMGILLLAVAGYYQSKTAKSLLEFQHAQQTAIEVLIEETFKKNDP